MQRDRCWCEVLSDALCRKGVGGFGNDDPGYEVGDGADTSKESEERGDDANNVEVPAVVERETRADACNHAVLTGAGELAGVWIVAGGRRRSGGDGSSAGGAVAGGRVDSITALGTEHGHLRMLYFAIAGRVFDREYGEWLRSKRHVWVAVVYLPV